MVVGLILIVVGFIGPISSSPLLYTEVQDVTLVVNESYSVKVDSNGVAVSGSALISVNHDWILSFSPKNFSLSASPPWGFSITGLQPGHAVVYIANTTNGDINIDNAFVRVTVEKSRTWATVSTVVGWIYFVAWSVSFYPQIYENWRRKSVVGLNFDFLALNIIGFTLYSMFNCGLYWNSEIEAEYFELNPKGVNPVLLNDIVFSVHAAAISLFTIFQCFIYERQNQRVSLVAKGIIGIFVIVFLLSMILALCHVITWLSFLYICSYIKLTITLIKYIPQAYMNYKRKSTIGWSIGNVLLDFTGGMLSMMQMIINADNYDDWASIFGDATKFGLGLFSVLFDVFFFIQHYILYRTRYEEIPGGVQSSDGYEEDANAVTA